MEIATDNNPPFRLRSNLGSAQSGIYSLATALVGVANLLYHPFVSRELSVSDYGALGALLGVLTVLAVPVASLQIVIARDVVEQRSSKGTADLRPLFKSTLAIALVLAIASAVTSPLLLSFIHVDSTAVGLLLAAYFLLTVLQVVPVAFLLSEGRFWLAGLAVLAGAVTRLALADSASSEWGLTGAMLSNVAGALVALVVAGVGALVLNRGVRDERGHVSVHYADALVAIAGLTGFWALHGVHTLMARIFLPSEQSGFYAAAAIVGQIGLFVPSVVATVVFPGLAAHKGKGPAARALLVRALAIVIGLAVSIAVVIALAHDAIVEVVFGSAYGPASATVGLLAFVGAAAGVVYVLVFFFLAGKSRAAGIVPWAGVAMAAISISLFHSSAEAIGRATLASVLVTLALMAILALTKGRKPALTTPFEQRVLWDSNTTGVDLTMVVPFFNPGAGVGPNIDQLANALDESEVSYEIIAVSDGSTDDSADIIEQLQREHVRVVRLEKNAGKGQALRVGMAMGRGHYLGFIDADGDINPALLKQYTMLMKAYEPDIIFGSKRHPMSEVEYPLLRRLYSFGYQQLIRGLFRLNVRDTQVGLKLVRRDVLAGVLPRMLEKRFAFDLELFVVSRHLGYRRVFEAPIKINHGFTSTVSWRSVRGMMLDTMAIFYRLHLLHFYDEPQPLDVDGEPVETRTELQATELPAPS